MTKVYPGYLPAPKVLQFATWCVYPEMLSGLLPRRLKMCHNFLQAAMTIFGKLVCMVYCKQDGLDNHKIKILAH